MLTQEPQNAFFLLVSFPDINNKTLNALFHQLRQKEIFNNKLLAISFFKVLYSKTLPQVIITIELFKISKRNNLKDIDRLYS